MGWDVYNRPPGETDAEHLQRELFGASGARMIAHGKHGRTFYAAVENPAGDVFGLVVLQGGSGPNYSCKVMSENMGPHESHAPACVLDALTETDSEYAQAWRTRCRENLREVPA